MECALERSKNLLDRPVFFGKLFVGRHSFGELRLPEFVQNRLTRCLLLKEKTKLCHFRHIKRNRKQRFDVVRFDKPFEEDPQKNFGFRLISTRSDNGLTLTSPIRKLSELGTHDDHIPPAITCCTEEP